jgi:hypothetical protein
MIHDAKNPTSRKNNETWGILVLPVLSYCTISVTCTLCVGALVPVPVEATVTL